MPKVSVQVPEVYESISRPVSMEIIRFVMNYTGLPKDTLIQYSGVGQLPVPEPGSSLDAPPYQVRFPASTKFTMEVTEDYFSEAPVNQANLRPEHQVVFADSVLGIYIKPVYQLMETTISVSARFRDQSTAVRWREDVRKLATAGRMEMLHEASYHFPIPLEFIVILSKLHAMREAVEGYAQTIGDYLRTHFTERHTVITNQAGKNNTIVIKERQIGIVGWFDFSDQPPELQKEGESGTYLISFDYKFRYEKAVACVLQYPLMIHNQMVPKAFRDEKRPYEIDQRPNYTSLTRNLLDKHSDVYPRSYEAAVGVAIPHWDDWLPESRVPGVTDLARIMLQVDELDKQALLSLNDLGHYEIDADALEYITDFPAGVLDQSECAFQCILYDGYTPMGQSLLTIDNTLTLRSSILLSMRRSYHMVLGLNYDLDSLSRAAKERLRRRGVFARALMIILMPNIEELGFLPPLLPDGSLPLMAFDLAVQKIAERNYYERATVEYKYLTVGCFVIEASRRT